MKHLSFKVKNIEYSKPINGILAFISMEEEIELIDGKYDLIFEEMIRSIILVL